METSVPEGAEPRQAGSGARGRFGRSTRHRREGPAAIATVTILNADGDFRFDVR